MKRSILLLLMLVFLISVSAASAVGVPGAAGITVSLRVEGKSETLYQDGALAVAFTGAAPTMRDVIDSYNRLEGVQKVTVTTDINGEQIEAVGALQAQGVILYHWMLQLNGKSVVSLSDTPVNPGDGIVIYYGTTAGFQHPRIDLTRMPTESVVRFFSAGLTYADGSSVADASALTDGLSGGGTATEFPVAGATVVWDGMTYITDEKGEIIIDSTGSGVAHSVSIERYDAGGLPTVLRLPDGFTLTYGFADVVPSIWYYADVMYMSDRQLLKGVSESDFAPDLPMNRAMFVTVLGRLNGASVDQAAVTGFSDVIDDGWSSGYIVWASASGIVGGYGNGAFGQYDPVTREQLAVMLCRYAQSMGIDSGTDGGDIASFSDADSVSPFAAQAVKWAVGHGLLNGAGGSLKPQEPATRAQVAAILHRFITAFNIT